METVRLFELFETDINDRQYLINAKVDSDMYKRYVNILIEVNGEEKIKSLDNDKIYKHFYNTCRDYISATGNTWKLYTNIGQYRIPFIESKWK